MPVDEDLIVDDLDCFELVLASTDMFDELIIPFTPLLLFVAIDNFDDGDLLLFSCINSLVKFIVDNAYGALLFCLFFIISRRLIYRVAVCSPLLIWADRFELS